MKATAKNFIKLGVVGATIFGIGAAFLTMSPTQDITIDVAPVEADVMSARLDDGRNFDNAMEKLGMKPRAYDFNGNKMFFGTLQVREDIGQTVDTIQRTLVESGVNSRNYSAEPPLTQMMQNLQEEENAAERHANSVRDKFLEGEVLITRRDKGVVEMGSLTGLGGAQSIRARVDAAGDAGSRIQNVTGAANGYRHIEVRRDEGQNLTEIVAVWTDDKFDDDAFLAKPGSKQSGPDPTVPACVGCTRNRRVVPLDKDEPYNINKWQTSSDTQSTYNFYVEAMARRGWTESGVQPRLDLLKPHFQHIGNIQGRSLVLEKEGKTIQINILPTNGGGSEVFSTERYEGTQPTLKILPKAND